MVRGLALLIAVGSFVILGTSGHAVTDAAKCKEAKREATGKKAFDLPKAFGKKRKKANAITFGADVSKAQSKFTNGFSKAQARGGCLTGGESDNEGSA